MSSPNSYVYSAPNLGIPSIISDSSDSAAFRLFIYQQKNTPAFLMEAGCSFPEIRTIMWQIHHFFNFLKMVLHGRYHMLLNSFTCLLNIFGLDGL